MSEPYYCTQCGSPRAATVCPRCAAATVVPCEEWEHPALPEVEPIRTAAREKGYAITEHGSRERDLDLVAVPWTEEACSAEELLTHLQMAAGLHMVGNLEDKPHGRIAVTLQKYGYYRPIDLSICPR